MYIGCIGTLPISLMSVFFGKERIAGALGFRSLITGVFNMAIPPFTGYLIEKTSNYNPVLYMCSAMSILGGICLLLVRINITKRNKNIERTGK